MARKIKVFLLLFMSFYLIIGCSKQEDKEKKVKVKQELKKEDKLAKLRVLKAVEGFEGKLATMDNFTFEVPESFKKVSENSYFEKDGTNLIFDKDQTLLTPKEYIQKHFKALKEDYSNTIKEEEELNIGGLKVNYAKFIIDRKKYLIQIESLVYKEKNTVYMLNVSGKKSNMDVLHPIVESIFSTFKRKT